jgi:hypothetical protein
LRQPLNVEKLAIDVVKVADAQIELITADAIDNLLRGERKQAELQLRVLPASGLISCIGLRLASGTIPTRSCPTIWPRQIAASASSPS